MIIPHPLKLEPLEGVFTFGPNVPITQAFNDPSGYGWFVGDELAQHLRVATGRFVSNYPPDAGYNHSPGAVLLTNEDVPAGLGDEGYVLDINPQQITLRASAPAGLFYACQSLIQWVDGYRRRLGPNQRLTLLPCVRIEDRPRFPWRGFMLDSVRHFQPVERVLRLIDHLAALKLNRFHWHLTDDQGWRLEILGYPKLTSVGAWRQNSGGRYGGFYTQEQVREVITYARQRQITVIPEIEMPGHNVAALAAYPELGCHGKHYDVPDGWGILRGVYCAGQDKTFRFLEDVLGEVAELFPGPYIHLGGDERKDGLWESCSRCRERKAELSLPDEAALQKWFMQRVADHVHDGLCRRTIVWGDNIDAGGIPGQIVQGWIPGQAIKAARQGLDTINSTNDWVYFDYPQTPELAAERPQWMKLLTLEKVYGFDPIPEDLEPERHKHILGSEAPLWTEYVPDEATLCRQVFPRLFAFSEAVWSSPAVRDWEGFQQRLSERPPIQRLT
ncbi:MAG: hypothetical protein Kow00105_03430 [Phycisphaeraceae bacterium]